MATVFGTYNNSELGELHKQINSTIGTPSPMEYKQDFKNKQTAQHRKSMADIQVELLPPNFEEHFDASDHQAGLYWCDQFLRPSQTLLLIKHAHAKNSS